MHLCGENISLEHFLKHKDYRLHKVQLMHTSELANTKFNSFACS